MLESKRPSCSFSLSQVSHIHGAHRTRVDGKQTRAARVARELDGSSTRRRISKLLRLESSTHGAHRMRVGRDDGVEGRVAGVWRVMSQSPIS